MYIVRCLPAMCSPHHPLSTPPADSTAVPPAANASQCPPHPGFIGGLCIRCGALRSGDANGEPNIALRYLHQGLELSAEEAERVRRSTSARALADRRLVLVLDLDHTLLNSTRYIDLTPDGARAAGGGASGVRLAESERHGPRPKTVPIGCREYINNSLCTLPY